MTLLPYLIKGYHHTALLGMYLKNNNSHIACNVPDYSFHWIGLVKQHISEFSQGELKKTCITKKGRHFFFVQREAIIKGSLEASSSPILVS